MRLLVVHALFCPKAVDLSFTCPLNYLTCSYPPMTGRSIMGCCIQLSFHPVALHMYLILSSLDARSSVDLFASSSQRLIFAIKNACPHWQLNMPLLADCA
ncbi:hypothetical protein BCR44DRAFT_331595 [Catenaria anguillulae PL171]|uniref:Uncharacterized protein n=1 Tax=Catenaria anguillulae PL171 TaxID=765915 RepID=A0A1Y2HMP2_9FUNG|nr:hypothetical protein BCR44DRAFT_331595 [Catenaria anguillulae PL171]